MIRDLYEACKIHDRVKSIDVKKNSAYARESAVFYLTFSYISDLYLGPMPNDILLSLDEEDIAYFMNKYLPKLQDELNEEINKLKAKYEG